MKILAFVTAAFSGIISVDGFAAIAPGAKIPSIELHRGFPPEMINIADYVKGRKVAVVGLPAAFTPVCVICMIFASILFPCPSVSQTPHARSFVLDLIRKERSRISGICRRT
jgi:hypothetical protein